MARFLYQQFMNQKKQQEERQKAEQLKQERQKEAKRTARPIEEDMWDDPFTFLFYLSQFQNLRKPQNGYYFFQQGFPFYASSGAGDTAVRGRSRQWILMRCLGSAEERLQKRSKQRIAKWRANGILIKTRMTKRELQNVSNASKKRMRY